ncbi:MAG: flippase-like domain-containing protein [Prevotella sp.]|nr:flippase-like domain-containing protein [Prevotella sp.]
MSTFAAKLIRRNSKRRAVKWSKQRLNNLFFVIGILAVVVMMLTFEVSFIELWHHLCHAGYWLIPILGVWVIIYGLNALSWRQIIISNCEGGRDVSWWRIYQMTITGYALNYATPVGGLGGEPYRIMELSRYVSKQHATSSVILYAMMHMFAHFWFWFISIFIYLALAAVGNLPLTPVTWITLGIIAVFCLIAFYLFSRGYRKGLVVKTIRWIGKIPGCGGWSKRFQERHAEALHNVDEQIAALHRQDSRAFYYSLLLEYFSRIVQSLEVFFMLLLFGIDGGGTPTGLLITFLHSILILSFTTLFANLIGFLPMQLGVQEGGFVISIAALGFTAALGIFVSIICRVREIIWIFIGLLLMRLYKEE